MLYKRREVSFTVWVGFVVGRFSTVRVFGGSEGVRSGRRNEWGPLGIHGCTGVQWGPLGIRTNGINIIRVVPVFLFYSTPVHALQVCHS